MTAQSAVTVGTFDGLHTGHRMVLECLRSLSEERGLRPMVVTFDRHPLLTVAPQRAPKMLMDADERDDRLRRAGFDVVRVPFTRDLASLTAAEWLRRMRDSHGVRLAVIGYDNTFGCDGLDMSIADYRRIGAEAGIDVVEAPVAKGASSSAVRRLVAAGDVETAADMLGRPFAMTGTVVHGRALGTTIGFPTANLAPDFDIVMPAIGVYSARAILDDGRQFKAVVNIGVRPTVSDAGVTGIEAHLIGFDGNLYGSRLRLEFLRRLRPEMRFDSIEQLKQRISEDVANAMAAPDVITCKQSWI